MAFESADFFDYLGAEEKNILSSVFNYKNEISLFLTLDEIYQNPLSRMVLPQEKDVVAKLFLFVHFYLYFSTSCLLRCHLSECLTAVRKAIDASLSAYKIIVEPKSGEKYLERDKSFLFIKNTIQRENKNNSPPKYPLAIALINIHEACSEFGSHADISSFFHRFEIKEVSGETKEQHLFHYFQFPRKTEEFKYYFIATLQAFYLMFKIFKIFLDENLKIVDTNWEHKIEILGPKLDELRVKYRP